MRQAVFDPTSSVATEEIPWQNQPQSAELTLPPLGVLYLVPED